MRTQDAAGQTTTAATTTGNVDGALASAAKVVSATYQYGYQMHGSIGPNCAIADVRPNSAMVLSSTQTIYDMRAVLATMLNLPINQVRVQYWEGASCFGTNCYMDVGEAAALMSQIVGKPVRLQNMRWNEHGWEGYGPAMLWDVRAGIDANGTIVGYDTTSFSLTTVPWRIDETTMEQIGNPIPP